MLNPRVLLTHIPLYRPDGTPCGKYRSSPIINQVCTLSFYFLATIIIIITIVNFTVACALELNQ